MIYGSKGWQGRLRCGLTNGGSILKKLCTEFFHGSADLLPISIEDGLKPTRTLCWYSHGVPRTMSYPDRLAMSKIFDLEPCTARCSGIGDGSDPVSTKALQGLPLMLTTITRGRGTTRPTSLTTAAFR